MSDYKEIGTSVLTPQLRTVTEVYRSLNILHIGRCHSDTEHVLDSLTPPLKHIKVQVQTKVK